MMNDREAKKIAIEILGPKADVRFYPSIKNKCQIGLNVKEDIFETLATADSWDKAIGLIKKINGGNNDKI